MAGEIPDHGKSYKRISARHTSQQRKFIKGQLYNLLANRGNLSKKGREELALTFKANRNIYTAYLLKEDFD